jgi:hypothetical protein
MRLDINTDSAVVFANKLERIASRELAYAARQALNSAAFDLKKTTMPAQAKKSFVNRSPNFFKANSRVDPAKGQNINTMQATVGFVSTGLKGGNNFAVKDLEQQESGGAIKGKSLIPTKQARIGSSNTKNVSLRNRLSSIKNVINTKNLASKNKRQSFRYAAAKAGRGGVVLHENILFRINNPQGKIKATPIYTYKAGRSVRVRPTHFMNLAALESGAKLEEYFIKHARKILAQ